MYKLEAAGPVLIREFTRESMYAGLTNLSVVPLSESFAIKFKVTFDSEESIPEFANIIAPAQSEETALVRTITMAFPMIYASATYEEFHEFLTTTINNTIKKQKRLTDTPVLTVEQQLQAYWHRSNRKVIH